MSGEPRRDREGGESPPAPQPVAPGFAYEYPEEELNLFGLVNAVLRHRYVMIVVPVVTAFLAAIFALRQPITYTADTSFLPQGGPTGQDSRLGGLASRFGIDVGASDPGRSPAFYAELIRNREVMKQAVVTRYRISEERTEEDQPRSGDLVELLGIRASSRPRAVAAATGWVQRATDVSFNQETWIVDVSVSTPWPSLSQQIADRLIELLNEFNLESRQTEAKAERDFIEGQLAEAQEALLTAEDSLGAFLQRNRRYENSPELLFQFERLQRRVLLRQEVYNSLAQSLEQVRMREVRNTPVITVLEPPVLPLGPDPRGLPRMVIMGFVLGIMLGGVWAFAQEKFIHPPEDDVDDRDEFERLKKDTVEDVRRAGRWLRELPEKARRRVGRAA